MKLFLGMLLAASSVWATPLTFNGQFLSAEVGYNLWLNYPKSTGSGFQYTYGAFEGPQVYGICTDWQTRACDLTFQFAVFTGGGSTSFSATDGTVKLGIPDFQAYTSGNVTFETKGIHLTSMPATDTVMNFPTTVFGNLKAWSGEQWLSRTGPSFDYSITGTGTVPLDVLAADAHTVIWTMAGYGTFTGEAEKTPEPGTWLMVVGAAALLLGRRIRDI